jgi:hypothetical protein
MLGEPPKVSAFKGEQAITSALIDVVEGKKKHRRLHPRPQGTTAQREGARSRF